MFCARCNKKGKGQTHHITYDPEKTINLCRHCHNTITAINTKYAHFKGHKLANKERIRLNAFFMNSDLDILDAIFQTKRKVKDTKKLVRLFRERKTQESHMAAITCEELLELSPEGKALIGKPFKR